MLFHDSAAVLLCEGDILTAVQEERFSRKKHDPSFPYESILYFLQSNEIDLRDIEKVIYFEKPLLTFERILEIYLAVAPRGGMSFI